jgi:transposase
MGAPSLPPGRYFRMHMIGYFEGLDSERGIVWRCSDSRSLGDFLRLGERDKVPDHSWLSKTRSRLPHEVHEKVFAFVLKLVAERGLVKGERIGVDGSTMEANAALRTIVRRDNGESYREMLTRMAKESGVETPTIDALIRLDRKRKGKKLSNEDWTSKTDPDARIFMPLLPRLFPPAVWSDSRRAPIVKSKQCFQRQDLAHGSLPTVPRDRRGPRCN